MLLLLLLLVTILLLLYWGGGCIVGDSNSSVIGHYFCNSNIVSNGSIIGNNGTITETIW